jgi:hypothetical protein
MPTASNQINESRPEYRTLNRTFLSILYPDCWIVEAEKDRPAIPQAGWFGVGRGLFTGFG